MALALRHSGIRELRATLGFSRESLARALDVSTRTVERWEAGATTDNADALRRIGELAETAALGREILGSDLRRFLATPRRSLRDRSPAAALMRGDLADVLGVLAQAHEGQWG